MTDAPSTPTLSLADDELFEQHLSPPGHPERPARLAAARQGVQNSVLGRAARRLPERDASDEELALAHEPSYVESLAETSGQSGHLDADTFYSPRSFDAARRASGAALAMTDALLDGSSDFGLALVRPPGHHARPAQSMGFCMINHVAVAARHALARGARRVVILDWDVHHGNGTEEIFEQAPEVLYMSLHQNPQYPGTGPARFVGTGQGRGYTVNVPLSSDANNAVYAAAFERIILPIIEQFAPDLTLVSAGYDAHRRDPLGGMQLDGHGYACMTRGLLDTVRRGPGQRIGFLLEGGYDLEGVRESVEHTLGALLSAPAPVEIGALPPRFEAELAASQKEQRQFWRLS